jgi:D-alanine-D-alanine ligase
MKIALTYNLKPANPVGEYAAPDDTYAEWDEADTIAAVRDALACEHEVILLEDEAEIESRLLTAQPDMVFNLAEGLGGPWREARLPALLERHGIPFTGSSSQTLRLCLDKAATKRALRRYSLPTPAFSVMHDPQQDCELDQFPLIVKPLHEGSSKGIWADSVVSTRAALQGQVQRVVETYAQPALVETFLPGREFTVALLGNGAQVTVLPLVEICFAALRPSSVPVYSYEAKWLWDAPDHPLDIFTCPAEIGPELTATIAEMSRQAFHVLKCRDWCRIDIRLDATDQPAILEMNPLPGILPHAESHSCFPHAAVAAGIAYPNLIRHVLDLACQRYGLAG